MNTGESRPDINAVLRTLKDFQRDTVKYVFHRLYLDEHPTCRFLIADEVGLGKTLVARGVIARAIDHLWDTIGRIDIVYICSNADIARQNVNRLNITRDRDFALASRITLLPIQLSSLKQNKLNFISFTPGTSFELKSSLGTAKERALLYWLLREAWGLRGAGPLNVLQGQAGRQQFRQRVRVFRSKYDIEKSLAAAFRKALKSHDASLRQEGQPTLRGRFKDLCKRFGHSRKNIPPEDKRDRVELVGELRALLAVTCIRALEPDLIILDEFQRFKHLLEGKDEASRLAQELFDYSDEVSSARVLLLSATPYKMYTLADEAGTDDHYEDFLRTLKFLQPDTEECAQFEHLVGEYRTELYRLGAGGGERLREIKRELETRLRQVMVRTERLASCEDRNGMLAEIPADGVTLEDGEPEGYRSLQQIARLLEQGDTIEYWKSAPYLLSFMDDYKLKMNFKEAIRDPQRAPELARLLRTSPSLLLPWDDVVAYREVDPANARLRWLMDDTVGRGAWRLLWIPSSLGYYKPDGPFADPKLAGLTKRLVFSAWRVVPRVVATLLSYEAERRMIASFEDEPENTLQARQRRRPLLRFAVSEGRITGMPVLGLLYPSTVLARMYDPLENTSDRLREGALPDLRNVVGTMERAIEEEIRPLIAKLARPGQEDESWYWVAPILLDLKHDVELTRAWWHRPDLATIWAGRDGDAQGEDEDTGWGAHVEQARDLVAGISSLGPPPADLCRVLAYMAIAGPGVCALRALGRITEDPSALLSLDVRDCAARIAWAFRNLFNLPEAMALVRGMNRDEPYWRRVLEYCAFGNLQAVLDEYAHVLRESLGLFDRSPKYVSAKLAEEICNALSLRTTTLGVDEVEVVKGDGVKLATRRMRARFALHFGEERTEEGDDRVRSDQVRTAFNSPFWPFILVTTSVGQEGLDFHHYCHAVIHWNLPSNPVDLEQREGRVHRYKGHAVRKNLAERYQNLLTDIRRTDLWGKLFEAAVRDRDPDASDLVPFWVYPLDDGAKIERHVPMLPLSREVERLAALRRSLVVYRMVFGQIRQEDIVRYLLERLPESEIQRVTNELRVDLSPPRV